MRRLAGTSVVEGFLIDWVARQPVPEPLAPVELLSDVQVAAEIEEQQRSRARQAAREAELILRLAALRPTTRIRRAARRGPGRGRGGGPSRSSRG